MPIVPILALLLGTLLLPAPVRAWSEPGHRIVAELAERELTQETRRHALDLLEGEATSLADIAAWADRVRDRPEYEWSRRLHFVNLPDDCSYVPARDCADEACIVAAIERFGHALGDRTLPREVRAEALKFVVHFVGDLHQPLHAGHAHDLGGNRHQVNLDGRGTNLHSVWDRDIVALAGLEWHEYATRLRSEPLPAAGPLEPARWAVDSCRIIGEEAIYPPRRRISEAYLQQHQPRVEAQLRLAGARLAAVLEQALGGQ